MAEAGVSTCAKTPSYIFSKEACPASHAGSHLAFSCPPILHQKQAISRPLSFLHRALVYTVLIFFAHLSLSPSVCPFTVTHPRAVSAPYCPSAESKFHSQPPFRTTYVFHCRVDGYSTWRRAYHSTSACCTQPSHGEVSRHPPSRLHSPAGR